MKKQKNILYLVNIPSPYMVTFFNLLSEFVNLTVIFEKKYDKRRPLSWKTLELNGFKHYFLRGISYNNEQIIPFDFKKYLKINYSNIFIQNFFTPTGMMVSRYLKRKNISYTIVSEGGYIKKKHSFKHKLKKNIISNASHFLSSSSLTDHFLINYGADQDQITRYPFTTLKKSQILKTPLTKKLKMQLREKYNIPKDQLVILSIGRLSKEKNHLYVIENLKKVKISYVYILIGDGKDKNILKQIQSVNHIYINHLEQKMLLKYYQMADIFVLASISEPWGLVVNEAMSQGCVVASSQNVNSSKELINKENGFIFDIMKPYALANIINHIHDFPLEEMRRQTLNIIQDYNIENMAEVFKRLIYK